MLVAEASLTRYLDLPSFKIHPAPLRGPLALILVRGDRLVASLLQVPEYFGSRTSQVSSSILNWGPAGTTDELGCSLCFHLNANLVSLQARICLKTALGLPEGLWHGQDGSEGFIRRQLSHCIVQAVSLVARKTCLPGFRPSHSQQRFLHTIVSESPPKSCFDCPQLKTRLSSIVLADIDDGQVHRAKEQYIEQKGEGGYVPRTATLACHPSPV